MKCFIGIGTNLGIRRGNIESAAQKLKALSIDSSFRISPIYQTPALMPEGAPQSWDIPFLNAVAEISWTQSPELLLKELKQIEIELGRIAAERWAPRILDLDILTFGDLKIQTPGLQIPHPEIFKRSFVLDPLKDLDSKYLAPSRQMHGRSPLIMAILNLTPDSFSDGGSIEDLKSFETKVTDMDKAGVSIFDLGAESTRPGATPVSEIEEWKRLEAKIVFLKEYFKNRLVRPIISIDTQKAEIAEKALNLRVDWINDVRGVANPKMQEILKDSSCDIVVMHDQKIVKDPILEIQEWFERKLETLEQNGIASRRVIFDPGIGFGKTAEQSIAIIENIRSFIKLPVEAIGHSRKSFMKVWNLETPKDRDPMTLSISKKLAENGIDILRVHDYKTHLQSFLQYQGDAL